jgi:DNA-binding transcriptional ArsR family regulator
LDTTLLLTLVEKGFPQLGGLLAWVTRVQSKVLESPERLRIIQIVYDRPGVSVTELANSVEMSWGQLSYHLGRLADAGLLHTVKAGRHRLVFPDKEPGETPEDRAMILERTARALALLIVDNPHVRATDLVRLSGESPRVVYYHVKRLLDSGLVSSSSGIHHRGLTASSRLVHLLGSVGR